MFKNQTKGTGIADHCSECACMHIGMLASAATRRSAAKQGRDVNSPGRVSARFPVAAFQARTIAVPLYADVRHFAVCLSIFLLHPRFFSSAAYLFLRTGSFLM
jgi:hypothetical protein